MRQTDWDVSARMQGTLMALGGFGLGIVLAGAFAHMPGNSTEWAAWVQAIGAIVAVFSGAFLIRYQGKLQRIQKRQSAIAILGLAIESVEAYGEVPDDYEEAFLYYITLNLHRIEYAYDQMRQFPLSEIDSVTAMVHFSRAVDIMREFIGKHGNHPQNAPMHIVKEVVAASYKGDIHKLKQARELMAAAT